MMMAASAGWPMVQLHRLTLAIILTLSVPASPFFLPVRGISPSWARSGAFSRNLRGTNARTLGVRGAAMLASEEDFQSEAVRSEPAVYLLKCELLQDTFQARAEAAFRAARAQWPRCACKGRRARVGPRPRSHGLGFGRTAGSAALGSRAVPHERPRTVEPRAMPGRAIAKTCTMLRLSRRPLNVRPCPPQRDGRGCGADATRRGSAQSVGRG